MYHQLVSHNPDIQRLIEKGYAVGFDSAHLIVRDIPYLDNQKNLRIGAIVCKLEFINQFRFKQVDHQIYFCGSHPHTIEGTPIPNLGGGPVRIPLKSKDVTVERSFSSKPKATGAYASHFEKIESYVTMISGPAMHLHEVTPLTFKVDTSDLPDSVFLLQDTLSSRAEISDLNEALKNDTIAIIGLGGTGSYLLDFLVKTSVKEIRGFDSDKFHVHNAFRSPGRLETQELGSDKAVVYRDRYASFRKGIIIKSINIDENSQEELKGVTFAFVAVDNGFARKRIIELLISMGIPFIDVGIGLNRLQGPVDGMLRTTYYSTETAESIRNKGLSPLEDDPADEYRNNIQIAELNALNAALAVIKYKQLRGFYAEEEPYYHSIMSINDTKVLTETENEPSTESS